MHLDLHALFDLAQQDLEQLGLQDFFDLAQQVLEHPDLQDFLAAQQVLEQPGLQEVEFLWTSTFTAFVAFCDFDVFISA